MNNIMETVTWLGFFSAIILSFYFNLQFRNKERMALIEKGVDISEIFKRRDVSFKFPWLRLGILTFGIGIGTFVAFLVLIEGPLVSTNHNFRGAEGFILTFSLLIFGGLAIIIGHIIERSGKKKNG